MRLKRMPALAAVMVALIAAAGNAQEAPSKRIGGATFPSPSGPERKQRPTRQQLIDTYGTADISYYRIPSSEFTALGSSVAYSDYWEDQPFDIWRRYSIDGNGVFVASPHLPSGATIVYFELDGCNTDTEESLVAAIYDCDSGGDCTSTAPVAVGIAASAGCTSSSVSAVNFTVDNFLREQVVAVQPGGVGNTTTFSGAIIGYHLNVSPAPGVNTFNDVPTSSPQFQFVEALVAAGVTVGCGGGNYCPDNPVTRGQMAVFLAKALGLQFK